MAPLADAGGGHVRYGGDARLHDAQVVRLERRDGTLVVTLRATDGGEVQVTFRGVESMNAERPEGMVVYALTEWDAPAPLRRFVFANWNEDDDATLEVTARGVGWSVVGKA